MLGKKLWLWVSMMAVLAGCGGSANKSSPEAQSPGGYAGSHGTASTDSAPASSPARTSVGGQEFKAEASSAQPATPPSERAGLGTEWGEARSSRVHDVTFSRDSSRPFAIASMNYNDKKGVDALVAAQGQRVSFKSLDTGNGAISVSIRDSSGDPLEAVKAGGRTFVIGQSGERYSVVLKNNTSHRFEAVATVDGLDVINGKDGTFDNRGYVLMPFATLEIEGFRQSTQQVAAFRFAAVGDSYAGQMGKARNVGVIGVAFFLEKGDSIPDNNETKTRDTASPFPADPRFAQPPRR